MKWDIDKALTALENSAVSGTAVQRVFFSDTTSMEREGIKPTQAEREKNCGNFWCISLGQAGMRKAMFYGRSIHEAYLATMRGLKKFEPSDMTYFGIKLPKKSNSYIAARKLRAGKKKS